MRLKNLFFNRIFNRIQKWHEAFIYREGKKSKKKYAIEFKSLNRIFQSQNAIIQLTFEYNQEPSQHKVPDDIAPYTC